MTPQFRKGKMPSHKTLHPASAPAKTNDDEAPLETLGPRRFAAMELGLGFRVYHSTTCFEASTNSSKRTLY